MTWSRTSTPDGSNLVVGADGETEGEAGETIGDVGASVCADAGATHKMAATAAINVIELSRTTPDSLTTRAGDI